MKMILKSLFKSVSNKLMFSSIAIGLLLACGLKYCTNRINEYSRRTCLVAMVAEIRESSVEWQKIIYSLESDVGAMANYCIFDLRYHRGNFWENMKTTLTFVYSNDFYKDMGGCGIWYVPRKNEDNPRLDCIFYSVPKKRIYTFEDYSKSAVNYDYRKRPWYGTIVPALQQRFKETQNSWAVQWSGSYPSFIEKGRMYMSLGSGVFLDADNDGEKEMYAVVTMDVPLDVMLKALSKMHFPVDGCNHLMMDVHADTLLGWNDLPSDFVKRTIHTEEGKKASYWYRLYDQGRPSGENDSVRVVHLEPGGEEYLMLRISHSDFVESLVIVPSREMISTVTHYISILLYFLLGLVVLVASLSILMNNYLIVKPLQKLMEGVKVLGTGSLDVRFDESRADEIGQLGCAFNNMETGIKEYIVKLQEETRQRERMAGDMNMAMEIQSSCLPDKFPAFPEFSQFDIFASMHPARKIGGDFYDFCMSDNRHLYFIVADVSGKGVPAALFMMCARTIIHSHANGGNASPAEILRVTNAALCENNKTEMFVTALLGCLDVVTGKLTLANAGHNPPVLIRNGKSEFVKLPHGFILAMLERVAYHQVEIQLQPGDKFYCYTDGVNEAQNCSEELFGTERMLQTLDAMPQNCSVRQVLEGMDEALALFCSNAEQADDITQLCIVYNGPETQVAKTMS